MTVERLDVRRRRRRRRTCPICGAPPVEAYQPFCSRRCQRADLGNWFGERYAIPAVEPPDGGDLPRDEDPDTGA
jgi:endogenous inhibitor of DNA gyrase (YacG/DUF329 family)